MTKREKSQRPQFIRVRNDDSVGVGAAGNQMHFEFVDFIHTELDKLKSLVENAPHARAKLAAIRAVVKHYRGLRRQNSDNEREPEQGRVALARQVAPRKDDGDSRRTLEDVYDALDEDEETEGP